MHAQAITHAIIPGQVGTGFRRRDDVVSRDGVIRVRHADFNQSASQLLEDCDARLDLLPDACFHPLAEILFRDVQS